MKAIIASVGGRIPSRCPVHLRFAFNKAFVNAMSLRVTVMIAAFVGFSAERVLSYLALRSGLTRDGGEASKACNFLTIKGSNFRQKREHSGGFHFLAAGDGAQDGVGAGACFKACNDGRNFRVQLCNLTFNLQYPGFCLALQYSYVLCLSSVLHPRAVHDE